MPDKARRWQQFLGDSEQPAYRALADAIAEDIRSGVLHARDRLPPLRDLSRALSLNYSTVARGYAEAQRRGLIDSRPGQGSFVRASAAALTPPGGRGVNPVDMTMNLPPEPEDDALWARLARGQRELMQPAGLPQLLRYQNFGGDEAARDAGARWLAPLLPRLDPARVLVCPGIQSALTALISTLVPSGEVLCCEAVTYPGVKALCAQFGIRLHGLPMDAEGIVLTAFESACRLFRPRALYCNLTLQNPTTLTTSPARRDALARIAQQYGVAVIEDDAYGLLPETPLAPLTRRAPELSYYVSGLAKHVGAGLRIAYLVAPDAKAERQLVSALRAMTIMAPPMMSQLATRWINDGSADAMLRAIRRESQARQRLAARLLPRGRYDSHRDGFHLWLRLPAPWTRKALTGRLRGHGHGLVASDAFTVSGEPPEAVRVCLGGPGTPVECARQLQLLADTLSLPPGPLDGRAGATAA